MKKILIICAAVATLGTTALVSTEASAFGGHHGHHGGYHHGGWGGGWGWGGYGYGNGYYNDCELARVWTPHGFRWRCI